MDLKQLAEEITNLKKRLAKLEYKKFNKEPSFVVEVPGDVGEYYTVNLRGELQSLNFYPDFIREQIYKRGEAFEYKEDALAHDKEKILLKKLEDWADWRNDDWHPNWEECDDKYYIYYSYDSERFCVGIDWNCDAFYKLPYFKTEEIAEQFIEEFGDEIKEVLL